MARLVQIPLFIILFLLLCLSTLAKRVEALSKNTRMLLGLGFSAVLGGFNFSVVSVLVLWGLVDAVPLREDLNLFFTNYFTKSIRASVGVKQTEDPAEKACAWVRAFLDGQWVASWKKRVESALSSMLEGVLVRCFGLNPKMTVNLGSSFPVYLSRFEVRVLKRKLMVVSKVSAELEDCLDVTMNRYFKFGVKKLKFEGTVSFIFGSESLPGVFEKEQIILLFDRSCEISAKWSGFLAVLNSPIILPFSQRLLNKMIPLRVQLGKIIQSYQMLEREETIDKEGDSSDGILSIKSPDEEIQSFQMTEKDYNFDLEAPLGILSIKVIGCVNTEKKGEYVHSIACPSGTEIIIQLGGRKLFFRLPGTEFVHDFDFAVTEKQIASDTVRMQVSVPKGVRTKNNFIKTRGENVKYAELPVSYLVEVSQIACIANLVGRESTKLIFRTAFRNVRPLGEKGVLTLQIPDLPYSTIDRFVLEIAVSGCPPPYERHFGESRESAGMSETVHIPFESYDWDCVEIKLWKFIPFTKKTRLGVAQEKVKRRLPCLPENILIAGLALMKGTTDADPYPEDEIYHDKIVVSKRQFPLSELNANFLEIELGQDLRGNPFNLKLLYTFNWIETNPEIV